MMAAITSPVSHYSGIHKAEVGCMKKFAPERNDNLLGAAETSHSSGEEMEIGVSRYICIVLGYG